jgi:hypothetical protein
LQYPEKVFTAEGAEERRGKSKSLAFKNDSPFGDVIIFFIILCVLCVLCGATAFVALYLAVLGYD